MLMGKYFTTAPSWCYFSKKEKAFYYKYGGSAGINGVYIVGVKKDTLHTYIAGYPCIYL